MSVVLGLRVPHSKGYRWEVPGVALQLQRFVQSRSNALVFEVDFEFVFAAHGRAIAGSSKIQKHRFPDKLGRHREHIGDDSFGEVMSSNQLLEQRPPFKL
jgi:hypothetical protein